MTTDGCARPPVGDSLHGPMRDWRVVLLTITAGAVLNAVSFIALGKVFSSVITGNMVLLGVAATTDSVRPSTAAWRWPDSRPGCSSAPRLRPGAATGPEASWPGGVTAALAAEVIVLAAFCAGWEAAQGRPAAGPNPLLILLTAAMGMQFRGAAGWARCPVPT